MADSKIDFAFENLHFSCEGDNAWVEKQLNNVLSRIPALLAVHKKGESIVEEVIDIQEIKPRVARSKAAVKPLKAKAVKTVKEEVAKEPEVKAPKTVKITKEKTPKAPKAVKLPKEKAPKTAKVAKVLKVKVEKVVKAPKEKAVKVPKEKAVKVAKVKAPKVPKVKKVRAKAKKKVVKKSPFVERTDSPLYQFILEKKAEKNQIRKFLATAVYLTKSNEMIKLSTSLISKELKSSGIEMLQNASDCLNKNEKKGYCIKEGKEFVVSENGFLSIG